MKYKIDKREGFSIIALQDENINSMISSDLKSEFVMFKTEGVLNLIVDMSEVKYIDSSGLSAILTGSRLWKEDNALFVLSEIKSDMVSKLIEISKLNQVLTIIPTLDEAKDYVKMDILEKTLEEE